MNWGRAETTGNMQWWRRVNNVSQRKNKPQPILTESFLRGLNEFLAKLCQDDSYMEPLFLEIDGEKYLSLRPSETKVMLALSKIKKIASGPDNIPTRLGTYACVPIHGLRHGKSLSSVHFPRWRHLRNTKTFMVLFVTPVIARCFEKIVYHKFSKHAFA